MNHEDVVEKLASLEHDRWSHWMRYLFTKGHFNDDGTFVIEHTSVAWWQQLINTPYEDLTEKSKDSDRTEVRKTLVALGEWLSGFDH